MKFNQIIRSKITTKIKMEKILTVKSQLQIKWISRTSINYSRSHTIIQIQLSLQTNHNSTIKTLMEQMTKIHMVAMMISNMLKTMTNKKMIKIINMIMKEARLMLVLLLSIQKLTDLQKRSMKSQSITIRKIQIHFYSLDQ